MPRKAKRICAQPGCGALVERGKCDRHRGAYDRQRGTAAQRGYGALWQRESRWFLSCNPLCVDCKDNGRTEPATLVHHEPPHEGDMRKFWDVDTWVPLCAACHGKRHS